LSNPDHVVFVNTAGPAEIDCEEGRCFAHTTKNNFNCGNRIKEASDDWGSFHTLVAGDDTTSSFHGYESIDGDSISIPQGCTLDCSNCSVRSRSGLGGNFRMFKSNDAIAPDPFGGSND
jgi:hypothetical protein